MSKHRRAGPMKARGTRRRIPPPPPIVPREARTRPTPRAPAPKVKPGAPLPVNPWMATRAFLDALKPDKAVMIDAGAHNGNVTKVMLSLYPNCRIYAFDPDPESIKNLKSTFASEKRVTVVPLALGSREGTSTFHICGQGTEMSSLLPRSGWKGRRYYRHEVKDSIRVETITLDAFLAKEQVQRGEVHFLKMDVQGGEKLVLRGAEQALKEGRIHLLYSEVMFAPMYKDAWEFWEMSRYLSRYDYTLFDIYNLQRSWICRQLKYGDAMWVSPAVRESIINKFPDEWLKSSLGHRMCPER